MKRLLQVLFGPTPQESEGEGAARVAVVTAKQEREADSLMETIREFLDKNDRVTGRPVHVRKTRS